MEGNILKLDVTKEDIKRRLETLIDRLENTKDNELSSINDSIVENGYDEQAQS